MNEAPKSFTYQDNQALRAVSLLDGVGLNRRICGGGGRLRAWLGRFGLLVLHDVDATLEIRAILDDDARGFDVTDKFGVFTDLDLVQCLDISVDASQHDDFTRLDAGADAAVRPHSEPMVVQFNGPFNLSIHDQVLAAED